MADGLVGSHLPVVVFYFPVLPGSPHLPDPGNSGSRYWTMVASAAPDMEGSPEQTVWFRFQQIECEGEGAMVPPCKLIGSPQFWDTYWFSQTPGGGDGVEAAPAGPPNASTSAGFYLSLLENRWWWDRELTAEGMMELELPSPPSTNGTYLKTQMVHQLIMGMITWHDTWGPRYGVLPG